MDKIKCMIICFPTVLFCSIPTLVIMAAYSGNSHLTPFLITLLIISLILIILWVSKYDFNRMKRERERL